MRRCLSFTIDKSLSQHSLKLIAVLEKSYFLILYYFHNLCLAIFLKCVNLCSRCAVDRTTNDDTMSQALSAEVSADEARDHEVEPEDVEAHKATHKGVEHVERTILHVLTRLVIAFFMQTIDDVNWEVPQSKVHP